jgi:hypothetical protein
MPKSSVTPQISNIFKQACECRICFQDLHIKAGSINIAQPRYIGPGYRTAQTRILILMINPGSGKFRADQADSKHQALLRKFRDGEGSIDAVFEHQRRDKHNWGTGGNFLNFLRMACD